MAKLPPAEQPRSTLRAALVPRDAFLEASVDPGEYPLFCSVEGDVVRVAISPAAHDFLKKLGERERDAEVIAALPGAANADSRRRGGTYRLWATDFALRHGARTRDDVNNWLARHGVVSRSAGVRTLNLPSDLDSAEAPRAAQGEWWIRERDGTTFHLAGLMFRTGRAGSELFDQLLESLDEDVVREIIEEAVAWAPEANRRFVDRAGPRMRGNEEAIIVEAILRALGGPWHEAGQLGLEYRPPSRRVDLSVYLDQFSSLVADTNIRRARSRPD